MNDAKKELNEYWEAVSETAEIIMDEYRNSEDEIEIDSLIHEHCDQHERVIDVDLNVLTLHYSKNSCAGFFDGTVDAKSLSRNQDFPFAPLAAAAFEADVSEKVHKMISGESY